MKSNFRTHKLKILLLFFLVFTFVIITIIDFLITTAPKWLSDLIKILQIFTASGATYTLNLTIFYNKQDNKKNLVLNDSKYNDIDIIEQNNNGTLTINNTYNDPGIIISGFQSVLSQFQEENITKITKKLLDELQNESIGMVYNKDFILKYISESSNISNEIIQNIWVKLLVQESKIKDSVSKRTLDIVKNLTSEEAKIFENICNYSFSNGVIPKNIIESISFIDITKLQDIGLLKTNDNLTNNLLIAPCGRNHLIEDSTILIINNLENASNEFSYNCEVLTSSGLELRNALNIKIKKDDFVRFGANIKKENSNHNLKITMHSINFIEESTINYQDEDLLNEN